MLAAIKNFQKRHKTKITGELTPTERAELVAAAKVHEDEFGWNVVVDPATGIRIGLPTKLVPFARDAAHGTRWSSAHGEVQVETFRIKEPDLKLAALFEREKREPATRKIETSVLHDDNFFISGMQGLKLFSVRAKLRDGEVRGFTILYDQMMETIVAPVMVAMASAFSPFPERSAPYAALAKSVEYGNGLVVSVQGHIVTDLKLTQGCQVIVASGLGDADRVAEDHDNGLALLRVYGPRKISPLVLTHDPPKSGELTLVGIPEPKEQDGSRKLTEIKARLAGGSAIELRQPVPMAGFSGAAALDAQGQFVGMMEMGHAVLASIEAAAPPVRLIAAETIRGFLTAHNVETAPAQTGDAKAAVVRIICVRK
jgi:Trypsin-like peptidase domain